MPSRPCGLQSYSESSGNKSTYTGLTRNMFKNGGINTIGVSTTKKINIQLPFQPTFGTLKGLDKIINYHGK